MYIIFVLLIMFFICVAFWRLLWAICRPIFIYVYNVLVGALQAAGMSNDAARALLSLIFLIIVLLMIFGR